MKRLVLAGVLSAGPTFRVVQPKWLESLPGGEARDHAVFEMVSWLAEKNDVEMARKWAESIGDAGWRRRAEEVFDGKMHGSEGAK